MYANRVVACGQLRFRSPFSLMLIAGSGGGKTFRLEKFWRNRSFVFDSDYGSVMVCAPYELPAYRAFDESDDIEYTFVRGYQQDVIRRFCEEQNEKRKLLILDDCLSALDRDRDSSLISDVVFNLVSHGQADLIILVQALQFKSSSMRMIMSNITYFVIFSSVIRTGRFARRLSSDLFPESPSIIPDIFATYLVENPFAYLIIDTKPDTPSCLRIRTGCGTNCLHPIIAYCAEHGQSTSTEEVSTDTGGGRRSGNRGSVRKRSGIGDKSAREKNSGRAIT